MSKSVKPKVAKAAVAKPASKKPVAKPTTKNSAPPSGSSNSAGSGSQGSSSVSGTGNSSSGGSIKSELSQKSSGNAGSDLLTSVSEELPTEEQELREQELSTRVTTAYEQDSLSEGGKQIEIDRLEVQKDQRDIQRGRAEVEEAKVEIKEATERSKAQPQSSSDQANSVADKKVELEVKTSEQALKSDQREVKKEARRARKEERKAQKNGRTSASNLQNGNTARLELGPVKQRLSIEPTKGEESSIMERFEAFQKEFAELQKQNSNPLNTTNQSQQLSPIEQQREKFLEAMQSVGPERLERMKKMMDRFESRMDDRGEALMAAGLDETKVDSQIEGNITNTYKHLASLVSAPNQNGQVFDQDTRKFLAENFMLHAADPTTMDQGSNSSCWLQAGTIVGMINSPDDMARYTAEVANSASFQDADGRHHRFNRGIFGLGYEERNWSIARSGRGSARSPVSKMFDEGMSAMVGRRTPNWGSFYGSQGSREIMRKVTGKTFSDSSTLKNGSVRQTLLLDGGYCNYQPRHVKTVQLSKRDNNWYVVQDNQWGESQDYIKGRVNGNLADWNVTSMSNRFNHFNPDGPDQNLGPVGPAFVRRNDDYAPGPGPGPGPYRNFFDNFQNNGPNINPFGPTPPGPVNYSTGMEEKLAALVESGELTEEELERLKSYLEELTEKGVSPELQEQFLPQLIAEVKAETAAAKSQNEDQEDHANDQSPSPQQ